MLGTPGQPSATGLRLRTFEQAPDVLLATGWAHEVTRSRLTTRQRDDGLADGQPSAVLVDVGPAQAAQLASA